MDFSWISEVETLSPAALTVRAQQLSPNDNGRLLWDAFMPRQNVDSMELEDISTVDWRPAADRRDWNMRGRFIPMITPSGRRLSFIPIEAYDRIEEEEINKLFSRAAGNQAVMREIIGANLPDRSDRIAMADYRRLELDTFAAWALGQVTQRNPQTGALRTISYLFDAGRYQVAAPAWNDGTVNGYNEFIAWLREGAEEVGSLGGAMLRQTTLNAIQADAPTASGVPLNVTQLQDQVSQDLGMAFAFYINERTVDQFTDAGVAHSRVKVWADRRVALVPAGETVGFSAFAPVIRAQELDAAVGEAAGIDVRGVTVYHDASNGGRELALEAQLNAFPVPNEGNMWVIDAGV